MSVVQPFKRPVLRWGANWNRGQCFEYASKEAQAWVDAGSPPPLLHVCHGLTEVTEGAGGHAWVERGGYAYDWQMVHVRKGKTAEGHGEHSSEEPLPIATFYERERPYDVVRITPPELLLLMLRHKHYGAFTADEVAAVAHVIDGGPAARSAFIAEVAK